VITRALGTDPNVDVDTFTVQAQQGDVFLICSDGLTTMVDVETINRVVSRGRHDLIGAARTLVREANNRGGDDNITILVFEIAGGEPDDETVEAATLAAAEEDTLHPPSSGDLNDGDTSIVSVEDIRSAIEAERRTQHTAEPELDEADAPTLLQYAVATLVIAALAAFVVFLVVRGLAQ
jgi:hypothetical protein